MAGRTPPEAVNSYITPLQQAISCVTPAVLDVRGGYYVSDSPHSLTLNRGQPARLRSNPPILLYVAQTYRIIEYEGPHGPWRISITGYSYRLADADRREILAYHWHPTQQNPITFPHLHLGAGTLIGRQELQTAHLPTGRIAGEDVLRLVIREFGVEPLRDDWADILDRNQSAYEE